MLDFQETSNCVTSFICHVPALFITLVDRTNKDKQFGLRFTVVKWNYMINCISN